MKYREWRKELTRLQNEIDQFDENYPFDGELSDYWKDRKPLTDALEAHYKIEGDAIEASEKE